MTATVLTGPIISAGNMLDAIAGVSQKTAVSPGPNLDYQGSGFLDVRSFPLNKEYTGRHAVIPAFYNSPNFMAINAVPQTLGTAKIAALANVTSGTAMTLAGASTGISINMPILPFGASAIATAAIVLDYGFELVNVTSGSKNVTVTDSTKYNVGMPLIIAQALTSTTPLITYVTGITSATVITVNDAVGNTNSAAPCGTGNAWGQLDNMPPLVSTYISPYLVGGCGAYFDPAQAICRAVSITGVSSGAGGDFLVSGWDEYGYPMTDTITVASGVNTVNSLKAFKSIRSVVPQFTDAHNYSVGTTDIIGLPLRSDLWEQLDVYMAGALITSSTGYVKAVLTSPATALTGDVRGTYALQTASDGTRRLVIYQKPSLWQMRSGPSSFVPLFGVAQV